MQSHKGSAGSIGEAAAPKIRENALHPHFPRDLTMTINIDPTLLSPKRAARINAAFEEDVEKAVIPGAVVLIARRGKLAYLEAFGYRDREKSAAMAVDSIFRIA